MTRLALNRHEGPLRLLKALPGPAAGDPLEAVILHPPGGLAGGDEIETVIDVGPSARVLATTPGAQKWYRKGELGAGRLPARSLTRLTVADAGWLDWVPQPAILFDGADARQDLAIELASGATTIGWEILIRGRAAMGERFGSGRLGQTIRLAVDGELWWQEQWLADAGDRLYASAVGWRGCAVSATVWCAAPRAPDGRLAELLERWRAPLSGVLANGASRVVPGLVLARLLGNDSEAVFTGCRTLWRAARLSLTGTEPQSPRIWAT